VTKNATFCVKPAASLYPIIILACLFITSNSFAATSSVCSSGCDFTTIQDALNNAADGDTISITDPVHTEADIIFWPPAPTHVTIEGQGIDDTILQGAPAAFLFDPRVFSMVDTPVTIRNLHIRHGGGFSAFAPGFNGSGGAVQCNAGTLTMENVRVSDSFAFTGGGIMLLGCNGSSFSNIIVESNSAEERGGGLYSFTVGGFPTDITVADSLVRDNAALFDSGGGVMVRGAFESNILRMSNTQVLNNSASIVGGGIMVDGEAELRVVDSTISGNTAEFGGGVEAASFGGLFTLADFISSTISGNSATFGGGGLNIDSFDFGSRSRMQLRNSTVSGNTSGDYAGGIATFAAFDGLSESLIIGTTIANNSSTISGLEVVSRAEFFGISETAIGNSIVANSGIENCGTLEGADSIAVVADIGGNTVSDFTCGFPNVDTIAGVDPKLGPLQDNGGPTETHAFRFADSPAVDRHNDFTCGQ
jgi:hypothetical protein